MAAIELVRPKLSGQALHGPVGDFWRIIEPHTEADPAAVAFQALAAFGNIIGKTAHFRVESTNHYLNLFVAVVGTTSKGRKGTSWGQVQALAEEIDRDWASNRILSGLSSGEGLIETVRDPYETVRAGKAIVDEGAADKRVLFVESEFGGILRILGREGSTLSSVLRLAWDSSPLRTLTRNSPAAANDAHVSVVGHITEDELLRHLSATEAGNGFANRVLWVSASRSKCLPEGGALNRGDLAPVAATFQEAVQRARKTQEMKRDAAARELWNEVYPGLSEGGTGKVGAVTSRAEAQAMRLACLYALVDCSDVVRLSHLEAALSAWRYSAESCACIFGDALGDTTADDILQALRGAPDGMSRAMVNRALGGRRKSQDIARALQRLGGRGLAERSTRQTSGRPSEWWVATPPAQFQTRRQERRGHHAEEAE